MAPPGFFSDLPFRPQQGKRKRAGSLPRDANPPKPANHATVEEEADEYFTQQPKFEQSEEDPHTAKRRRFNDPGDDKPVDDSQGVGNPDLASNFDDLKLRNRVIRRRNVPVSPFIPRKPRGIVKVRRPRPRQKPVFGKASLLPPDEQQLSDALNTKGPQVAVVNNLIGLPKVARDPAVGPEERSKEELHDEQVAVQYDDLKHNDEGILVNDEGVPVHSGGKQYYDEDTTVDAEEQDVPSFDNGSTANDTQVPCAVCKKLYHPAHIGKSQQDPTLYLNNNRRDQAMKQDAEFFRKKGVFTCNDCDNEALATKQQWAITELNAEKLRRNKLFLSKHSLGKGETRPHDCDNCQEMIVSFRMHSCKYCEDYDLCLKCFSDPDISSLHQHSAGDMKTK